MSMTVASAAPGRRRLWLAGRAMAIASHGVRAELSSASTAPASCAILTLSEYHLTVSYAIVIAVEHGAFPRAFPPGPRSVAIAAVTNGACASPDALTAARGWAEASRRPNGSSAAAPALPRAPARPPPRPLLAPPRP